MGEIFAYIGAILTIGLGIMGLFRPDLAAGMVGIHAVSGLGRSEVRATYGGLFIGLGSSCLWLQSTEAFLVAGIAWSVAAVARTIAIVIEREASAKNFGGVGIEGGIGALLLAVLL